MISSLKKAIPNDVRARLLDYAIITSLSSIVVISCLLVVRTALNNAFAEISNMLH
jgi:Flp pilus assembly pilin Flp